jgi:hypothetical protein
MSIAGLMSAFDPLRTLAFGLRSSGALGKHHCEHCSLIMAWLAGFGLEWSARYHRPARYGLSKRGPDRPIYCLAIIRNDCAPGVRLGV